MPVLQLKAEQSATYEDLTVYAQFIHLLNGYLLLVTDQADYGIGTIALSSPPSSISDKALSSPFNLFGLKHSLLANLVGKTASKHLKAPIVTMILIKNSVYNPKIITETAIKAVNKSIKHILEENQPSAGK